MSEQYYVLHQDQQQGPFSIEEIRRKVQDREFTEANLIWHEGLTEWKPISELLPSEAFPSSLITAHLETVAPSLPAQGTPPPLPTKPAWYDSNLAIFGSIPLSLFCICLPIGIIPLWLTKRFDRNSKIALTLIFALPFICLMLIARFGPKPSSSDYATHRPQNQEKTFELKPVESTIATKKSLELGFMMATIDAGKTVSKKDPVIKEYAESLDYITRSMNLKNPEVAADMTGAVANSLRDDQGIKVSLLSLLKEAAAVIKGTDDLPVDRNAKGFAELLSVMATLKVADSKR